MNEHLGDFLILEFKDILSNIFSLFWIGYVYFHINELIKINGPEKLTRKASLVNFFLMVCLFLLTLCTVKLSVDIWALIQIFIIVAITKDWKRQKRMESYAGNCKHILQNWYDIRNSLNMRLMGIDGYLEGDEKLIKETKVAYRLFWSLLENPYLYVSEEDTEALDTLTRFKQKFKKVDNWFKNRERGTALQTFMEGKLFPEEKDDKKRSNRYDAFCKEWKNSISKIFNILKEYAVYKRKL